MITKKKINHCSLDLLSQILNVKKLVFTALTWKKLLNAATIQPSNKKKRKRSND